MDLRLRALFREARSWVVPAIIATPVGFLLAAGTYALDPELARAVWIVVPIAPWLLIMLYDRWALFAIAIWLAPAAAILVVVSNLPVGIGWALLSGAAFLSGAALCMSDPVRLLYGRLVKRIADWLIEGTLPSRKRAAFRLLMRTPRRPVSDPGRVHRDLAFANRRMEAPDDAWKEALLANAAFHDLAADMLEGIQPIDKEPLKVMAGTRDRLAIEALRAQSPVYRLVNYSPFSRRQPGSIGPSA